MKAITTKDEFIDLCMNTKIPDDVQNTFDGMRIELSCSAIEQDEVDNGTIAPEDAEWWVTLIRVWDVNDEEGTERTYPEE